jgi:hypothetical protein
MSQKTGIDVRLLRGQRGIGFFSNAQILSWAIGRKKPREEDRAYSLMGLFDVHMSVMYSEGGEKAFQRLQREILRQRPDHSIFAWGRFPNHEPTTKLLAPTPDCFTRASNIEAHFVPHHDIVTDVGFRTKLKMIATDAYQVADHLALLDCTYADDKTSLPVLFLQVMKQSDHQGDQTFRLAEMSSDSPRVGSMPADWFSDVNRTNICLFYD